MTRPLGRVVARGSVKDPVDAFRAAMLAALGYAPDVIEPGRLQRFATSDKRGDAAGWCKLFIDLRGGVFGCHRQGISETWSATDHVAVKRERRVEQARQAAAATAERERQQRLQWAENGRRIDELWAETVPLERGDPVVRYLERRGIVSAAPLPNALRLHPALTYWHEGEKLGTFPALLAPLVAPGGQVVALHQTFLANDGRKADVPQAKKLTRAAGPLAGACIPLFEPVRGALGVAEGVETALAAWCASGIPMVAAYCAGNLAAWRWPPSVRRIVVFADHDRPDRTGREAGRDAANVLRARALAAGLGCELLMPTDVGADWADVWAQRSNVAAAEGAAS